MRFRFRHVNEVTGAFVIAVLVIVAAAVVFVGHSQRWFAPHFTLRVLLPEKGALGLSSGSEVFMLGISTGSVEDIFVGEDGRLFARVQIRRDFQQFVRTDSTATIKKVFGVAGDAFLEISRGMGDPLPERDAFITSQSSEELSGLAEELLAELRQRILPLFTTARQTLLEWQQLAADLRKMQAGLRQEQIAPVVRKAEAALDSWEKLGGDLRTRQEELGRLVSRLDGVVARSEQGEGTLGRLLADPTLVDSFQAVLAEGRALAAEARGVVRQAAVGLNTMRGVLQRLEQGMEDLPKTSRGVAAASRNLPGLVLQAQQTLAELERLVTGLQRHWLLREYMDLPGVTPRIPPSAVEGDRP